DAKSASGERRLLDFIGPPEDVDDDSPAPVGLAWGWSDGVAAKTLDALSATADLGALLEGVSRVRGGVQYFGKGREHRPEQLLHVARSRSVEARHRVAALTLLE